MRIAVFRAEGKTHIGVVDEDRRTIAPFEISEEQATRGVCALFEYGQRLPQTSKPLAIDLVQLVAPIPRPSRNIFCVGKNYVEHAREFAGSGFDSGAAEGVIPDAPIVFTKVPESVVAAGEPIMIDPQVSTAIDYEAELGVIVGKEGRSIPPERALEYVWGYTIINDVTARDIQARHKQWLLGKSLDTFCPMGPWVSTADELDLRDTSIRCWVNGELRQNANTKDLIFGVAELISAISRGITLRAGDVIATGTPSGVGIGFVPPRYLCAGDQVRIEIGGIGVLENPVCLIPTNKLSAAAQR
ncbi:hydrolase [Bradyrhizobium japonicum]|uniref:Hydrolase n=1 Tax=Bradyrhizobium japonicum TaxID=375 RepID=A0A1L3F9P1_BRAJP|nr:fumarylacetoacetate hydrolase family protein [Bradyrhizobium japonicum]APG09984.1 hydrolase [Bradyrhizobium japonicum]